MSRHRCIKPEFFTSEQVVECSPNARLLFIGLWCFCDDAGIHPASAKSLKMQIFPGDDFSAAQVATWITELLDSGLIGEYKTGGKAYWYVTGWHHQKIDRPTFKYPCPDGKIPISGSEARAKFDEHSTSIRRAFDEPSITEQQRATESKEEDLRQQGELVDTHLGANGTDPSPKLNGLPPCPHKAILTAWAEIMPEQHQPRAALWKPRRADYKHLAARWKEGFSLRKAETGEPYYTDTETGIGWWRRYFLYLRDSKFLMREFRGGISLPWIIKAENFVKTLEGKYHDAG